MKAVRPVRCAVFAVLLAAAGCSDPEGVRVLDEPKPARPGVPPVPADQKKFRTLAAMVPADSAKDDERRWWFLKMSGPAEVVGKYEADFDKLIGSLRVSPDPAAPIAWDLPAGWKREGDGKGMRFATLKAPGGDAEVSVTRFGGLVVSNVQRWWGQLWGKEREGDVTAANLLDFARERMVNGRLIFTVDMAGPKDPNAKGPNAGGPMMNPHGGS